MNTWQKIAVGAGAIGVLLALDLLKIQDPELRYACLGILGLVTAGHVAVNLPVINAGVK